MPARSDIRWLATARIAFSADLLTAGVSVISLSDASLINLFDGASRFRFPTRCRDCGKRKRKFGRTQPDQALRRAQRPSRSSARRARHARHKEAAARGSARLRASLDGRCARRSVKA